MQAVARACCQEASAAAGSSGTPAPALLSINCMSLASPAAVFARILAGLGAYSGSSALPRISGGRRASVGGADAFLHSGLFASFCL